ncbi:MAG: RNA polymerase sigma factor [Bacteroides sp.]|nr:RNA polymerase sigma factor [Bacteroides sp.]MCM1458247.1 RNA polymerase sigma factor [Lachnoclostridium sp.]
MEISGTYISKEERFSGLVAAYGQVIAKVCYLYASKSAPADDLYQETLINLWQGIDSFRGQASVSTWIYRVALNTCISFRRRHGRHDAPLPIESAVEVADDDSSAEHAAALREMYRLIGRLDPIDKAVVLLWLDERSYEEISEITGLSKANVATRLSRARTRLANDPTKQI